MAKPNPSIQKRIREQKKRLKREEKAQRKAERDEAKKNGDPWPADDPHDDTELRPAPEENAEDSPRPGSDE